jgi:hypothetical protein
MRQTFLTLLGFRVERVQASRTLDALVIFCDFTQDAVPKSERHSEIYKVRVFLSYL